MSEVLQRTTEELHEIAKKKGLVACIPTEFELTLDLDNGARLVTRVIEVLLDNGFALVSKLDTVSKHGNKHMWLRLNKALSVPERTTVQAACGSDSVREVLAVLRAKESNCPLALFETPKEALRVVAWRKKADLIALPTKKRR